MAGNLPIVIFVLLNGVRNFLSFINWSIVVAEFTWYIAKVKLLMSRGTLLDASKSIASFLLEIVRNPPSLLVLKSLSALVVSRYQFVGYLRE